MSEDEQQEQPNPYNSRNHETTGPVNKSDVLAVAGLLGQVSGALNEIDQRNVGGENPHIMAKKLDPKQALKAYAGNGFDNKSSVQPQVQQPVVTNVQQPVVTHATPPAMQAVSTNVYELNALERRVVELEKIVESYKNVVKFKRGVSYTINTAKISGEFKDVGTILDIVSAELAKQTKTITIKLNDNTKNKQ